MRANHSTSLGVATCVALGLAMANAANGYQQQMQSAADRIGQSMAKAGKTSLAVVDFTDLQGNATELGRFLAEQLSVALGGAGGTYEVIDRNHLRAILQEHSLSATGLIDPQSARKIGQMAGAECLVSGSITPFSENVNLSIKLLDTNTAKILGATTIDIPRTSTINELLAKGISGQLVTDGSAAASSKRSTATSNVPSAPVADVVFGVEVSIIQCKRSGRSVGCQGILENTTESTVMVSFAPFGGVELVDNLGNRSTTIARFDTGGTGGQWQGDVEPDLPIKFWITNTDVDSSATTLTARMEVGVGAAHGSRRGSRPAGGGGRETIVLRNIAIR